MTDTTPGTAPASSPRAVLFDLDGTLVDTNYLHVHAWWEAFAEQGHDVSAYDVHRAIGLPSADLVRSLLGREDEAVVEGHSARWAPLRPRAKAFHRAGDVLRACRDAGVLTAWATSGAPEDIERFTELIGVEPDVVVGSEDVERGKPDGQVVTTALERLGVAPERAVMVGDTTWDVRAAAAAGVHTVALLCGGIGEAELREAGAADVAGNPSGLLDRLDKIVGGTPPR